MANITDVLRDCHHNVWAYYAETGEKVMDTERALLYAFAELGRAVAASLIEGGDSVEHLARCAMMLLTAMGPEQRVTQLAVQEMTHAWAEYVGGLSGVMQMQQGGAWADYNLTQLLARIATHPGMDLPVRLQARLERIKAKRLGVG